MPRPGLLAAVAILAFPALSLGQSAPSLTGSVTDATTRQALAGVRIGVSGSSRAAVTDDQGRYHIEGLSAGDYTITASRLGTEPVAQTVHIPGSGSVSVNFALKPGSVLLSDVVVSASRIPESPRQVAATVNVMSRDQVRTNPARATDDLLREMPGVELPRTSSTVSGPEEIVSIRGADEGRTLVLLDNVPLNDPWGEWIQWNRAPKFQLDRAEVLEAAARASMATTPWAASPSSTQPILKRAYSLMASGGAGAREISRSTEVICEARSGSPWAPITEQAAATPCCARASVEALTRRARLRDAT